MAATVVYEGTGASVTPGGSYTDLSVQFEFTQATNPATSIQLMMFNYTGGNEVGLFFGNGPYVSIQQQYDPWQSTGGGFALNTRYICEARYRTVTPTIDVRIYPYGNATPIGSWSSPVPSARPLVSWTKQSPVGYYRVGSGDWLNRTDLAPTTQAKVYNGTTYINATPYLYNGTSWVAVSPRVL